MLFFIAFLAAILSFFFGAFIPGGGFGFVFRRLGSSAVILDQP
jgi:hypothetical protein